MPDLSHIQIINMTSLRGINMGKVTMQDIADALDISRVTVSKAFNDQAGVSDSLKELIFEKAREMGYAKAGFKLTEQLQKEERTVSLIVSRPDSAVFWTNIIHRMAQELSNYNINLMYTYIPTAYTKEFTLPSILFSGVVSGVIVLNVYDPDLLKMINSLSMPKVFLDTVPEITDRQLDGDLLLIEGYRTEYDITESVIKRGCKKIGFIGDIKYAMTNMERYLGYEACMKDYSLPIDASCCLTSRIGVFSYEDELYAFLKNLTEWPQAFVCASDYVAHFVRGYLDEHKEHLSDSIILTGFDNSTEYANVVDKITTANVPTGLLGKRLAMQILFRVDHPDAPHELTFICPSIVYHENIDI